jgi:hypothetical protein
MIALYNSICDFRQLKLRVANGTSCVGIPPLIAKQRIPGVAKNRPYNQIYDNCDNSLLLVATAVNS